MSGNIVEDINDYVLRIINVFFELCEKNSTLTYFDSEEKVYSYQQLLCAKYNKLDPNISDTLRKLSKKEEINGLKEYTRIEFYIQLIDEVLIGYTSIEVKKLKMDIINSFCVEGSSLKDYYSYIVGLLLDGIIARKNTIERKKSNERKITL